MPNAKDPLGLLACTGSLVAADCDFLKVIRFDDGDDGSSAEPKPQDPPDPTTGDEPNDTPPTDDTTTESKEELERIAKQAQARRAAADDDTPDPNALANTTKNDLADRAERNRKDAEKAAADARARGDTETEEREDKNAARWLREYYKAVGTPLPPDPNNQGSDN